MNENELNILENSADEIATSHNMEKPPIHEIENQKEDIAEKLDDSDIMFQEDENADISDEVEEDSDDSSEDESEETSEESKKTKKKWYKRWYVIMLSIIVAITLVFNCFFTIIIVHGDSMNPNFTSGNVLLCHRRFDIWRFDVVTIASTKSDIILIKRVIGLPNETIEFKSNQLFVNGEYRTDPYAYGNTEDFTITLGPDEYFCMGDNRENSLDSRYFGTFTDDEIFAKSNYKIYPKK